MESKLRPISALTARYDGFLLGHFLAAAAFRSLRPRYPVLRRRINAFLEENALADRLPADAPAPYDTFYRPALASIGYRSVGGWGGVGMEDYLEVMLALISRSGACFADVTGRNPNVLCYAARVTAPPVLPVKRGAGGTPGGVGQFFIGLTMAVVGGYLLLNQVQVTTSFWNFGRYGGFGLTLLPLLAGVAFLFYDGKSVIGWLLTALGTAIILASILMNMDIYFRPTSLFNTLLMLVLLFGGLGLIARSLRSV